VSVALLLLPTLSYFSFVGFLGLLVIVAVTQPRPLWDRCLRGGWLIWGIGLWLSTQFAYDGAAAQLQLANFLPFMAVMVALATWLSQTPRAAVYLLHWIQVLLLITVPVNLLAAVEYWLMAPSRQIAWQDYPGLDWFYAENYNFGHRADLLFGHPNTLACYLVFVFALGLGLLLNGMSSDRYHFANSPIPSESPNVDPPTVPVSALRHDIWQWLLPLSTFLNLIGLFSTGSRNGVMVAALIFGLALISSPGRWRLKVWSSAGLALLLLGVGIFGIGGRRFSWEMFTQDPRVYVWQIAWDHAITHPWVGIGLGNYEVLYVPQSVPGYDTIPHAHNLWLMLMAEAGFPLTLMLTGLVGLILYRVVRQLPHMEGLRRSVTLAYLLAFTGLVIFSLSDITIAYPRTTLLGWLALGAMEGLTAPPGVHSSLDQLRGPQTEIKAEG
jgi:hypothetical protein